MKKVKSVATDVAKISTSRKPIKGGGSSPVEQKFIDSTGADVSSDVAKLMEHQTEEAPVIPEVLETADTPEVPVVAPAKEKKLNGWAMEIMDMATKNFPDCAFTFKELLSTTDWAEEHPNVANVTPIMLGTLQKMRDNGLIQFVGRGVYALTGVEVELGEKAKARTVKQIPKKEAKKDLKLSKKQEYILESIRSGLWLEHIPVTEMFRLKDDTSAKIMDNDICLSLIEKGLVKETSRNANSVIYK